MKPGVRAHDQQHAVSARVDAQTGQVHPVQGAAGVHEMRAESQTGRASEGVQVRIVHAGRRGVVRVTPEKFRVRKPRRRHVHIPLVRGVIVRVRQEYRNPRTCRVARVGDSPVAGAAAGPEEQRMAVLASAILTDTGDDDAPVHVVGVVVSNLDVVVAVVGRANPEISNQLRGGDCRGTRRVGKIVHYNVQVRGHHTVRRHGVGPERARRPKGRHQKDRGGSAGRDGRLMPVREAGCSGGILSFIGLWG